MSRALIATFAAFHASQNGSAPPVLAMTDAEAVALVGEMKVMKTVEALDAWAIKNTDRINKTLNKAQTDDFGLSYSRYRDDLEAADPFTSETAAPGDAK